ncbi:hypothetical protein GCM10025771_30110 [Niveibacterium umoris]|uniref:DUF4136 domain-containing protein n=1 Tax=Niveibacterium umoris TaxID=1193620 RepID=A0A840BLN2_9RHOO|nr:hypothetical protein [Niveibacterium umoris]MBB4011796.1 hypothetical protein [Niveibacterium umoris]
MPAFIARLSRTIAIALLASSILAGCASTRLTSAWRDSDYQGPPMKKLVVIGVSEEIAARRVFEDDFAKALGDAGVAAIPGYRLLPDKPQRSVEEMRDAVAKSGADGILVARALRTERRTQYSPGTMTVMPAYGYRSFWGYYGAATVVSEPRIYQYDIVTIETNLWPATEGKVLWSGLSETTDPESIKKSTAELAKIVIGALREQRLIAAPPAK